MTRRSRPSPADGLRRQVSAMFAADGPLARSLPGYEIRPSQRAMAEAVAEVLAHGGTLLVEAGTGTGKTLAYLLPALLAGDRTIVSTGTRNLQDQILEKDLPLVSAALGRGIRATVMKGRGNYLCLHRHAQVRESGRLRDDTERIHLTLIDEWLPTTRTGDRAEVRELPEDAGIWAEVAATTETCLGSDCPRFQDCFVVALRQRAAEADLVIVNHHLLCADAAVRHHSFGEVIPEAPVLVIDEAHQLEDVVTQYFGVTVSNYRLDELVRDGLRLLGAKSVPDRKQAASLRAALARVERWGRELFSRLHDRRADPATRPREAGPPGEERVRLSDALLEGIGDTGHEVTRALADLASAVEAAREVPEDVRALGRRAREIRDQLAFVLAATDPRHVFFLETRGRGVFLRAAPIDVSDLVREHLLTRPRAIVLTSATLAVHGSFEYIRGRLGIDEAHELRLASEFDYRTQALLYLPQDMPDPRSPEFVAAAAREIAEILTCTEGRAFVLFTSYANLREVHARIATRVSYPLLVQGDAPRSVLLERFRTTPNSVLLATSSFWQGVDVVGEALSCVIIDKLPFASPGDPVVAARIEAIAEAGGNAFHEYQVPLAILTLLQGLGRLLRHRQDRGVMAVLDPRLRTKSYGRRFLEALPPAPVTHRLADIAVFLRAAG